MDINNHGYRMRKLYCLKTYHSKTYSFSYDRIVKLGAYEVYKASDNLYEVNDRIDAFLKNHECPDGEIRIETVLIPEDKDWIEDNDDNDDYEEFFNNVWEKRIETRNKNVYRVRTENLTGGESRTIRAIKIVGAILSSAITFLAYIYIAYLIGGINRIMPTTCALLIISKAVQFGFSTSVSTDKKEE